MIPDPYHVEAGAGRFRRDGQLGLLIGLCIGLAAGGVIAAFLWGVA